MIDFSYLLEEAKNAFPLQVLPNMIKVSFWANGTELDCLVPEHCPIRGRKFKLFTMEVHHKLGVLPLYDGPYDSYTVPAQDKSDPERFAGLRYMNDKRDWAGEEAICWVTELR